MIQAQWNKEQFGILPNSLRNIESFSISCAIKTEEQENSSGVKTTVVRGLDSEQLQISYSTGFSIGTDARQEFEDFKKMAGMQDNFYLSNVNVGRTQFELDEVQLSDTQTDQTGRIYSGKITLNFTGDSNVSSKGSKSKSKSSKAKKPKKSSLSLTPAELASLRAKNK